MKTDDEIIDLFGGNQAVADICAPTLPAVVSGWRKRGIPRAWRMLLKSRRPELFETCDPIHDTSSVQTNREGLRA